MPEAQRRRFRDDLAGATAATLGEFEKKVEQEWAEVWRSIPDFARQEEKSMRRTWLADNWEALWSPFEIRVKQQKKSPAAAVFPLQQRASCAAQEAVGMQQASRPMTSAMFTSPRK